MIWFMLILGNLIGMLVVLIVLKICDIVEGEKEKVVKISKIDGEPTPKPAPIPVSVQRDNLSWEKDRLRDWLLSEKGHYIKGAQRAAAERICGLRD
jgi:hypothetical protein